VRVVVVDDHRLFVDALALLLNHDERLEVIGTAGDGHAAMELIVEHEAEVAVIDVKMPEIDGLETARRMRALRPGTQVILVTGLDEPTLAERARAAGAVALPTKGALHEELREAIVLAAEHAEQRQLAPN
jgi:DNA-binding NarL/FixJ family response regulator